MPGLARHLFPYKAAATRPHLPFSRRRVSALFACPRLLCQAFMPYLLTSFRYPKHDGILDNKLVVPLTCGQKPPMSIARDLRGELSVCGLTWVHMVNVWKDAFAVKRLAYRWDIMTSRSPTFYFLNVRLYRCRIAISSDIGTCLICCRRIAYRT